MATYHSFAVFELVKQEGYEEHMASVAEFLFHLFNTSVTYSCFVYRSRSYIDKRPAHYHRLPAFDFVAWGGLI